MCVLSPNSPPALARAFVNIRHILCYSLDLVLVDLLFISCPSPEESWESLCLGKFSHILVRSLFSPLKAVGIVQFHMPRNLWISICLLLYSSCC